VTKLSKKSIAQLRSEADRPELWERVEGFTQLSQPLVLQLTPTIADRLKTLAEFHEAGSPQELAKRWLSERIDYELRLINKARRQVG
jgi:hypothetical protein